MQYVTRLLVMHSKALSSQFVILKTRMSYSHDCAVVVYHFRH